MIKFTSEQFEEWVAEMCERFIRDGSVKLSCVDDESGVVVVVGQQDNSQFGISVCPWENKFNIDVGIAIAYCRYLELQIPTIVDLVGIRASELKFGEQFWIKRNERSYFLCGKCPSNEDFLVVQKELGGYTEISKDELVLVEY